MYYGGGREVLSRHFSSPTPRRPPNSGITKSGFNPRINCAYAAHPLRIRCAAGTQAARWLKWGKTGNHLFPGGRSLWF
jgi:hypothetical protein